ncbi:MAG TPA: serine/threonine-protein kinase [Verrucomicrobiae bacterium]|jgi:serine/threonine protein kinase
MSQPEEPSSNDTPTPPLADPGAHVPPTDTDYDLVRVIGSGGYGEVWLVRDRSGNYLACKAVYRESFQSDRPYEREYEGICKFEPVSRTSGSQIKILHVGRGKTADYFFYIMELADDVETGQSIDPGHYAPKTLKSVLERRGTLPVEECLRIGISLCRALENLHWYGLIHRDIKPGNIIFVNDVPKLADIGLVTDTDLTVSYVGTEGFIPPEGPNSQRSDIYSLGKVLYEISTGKDRMDYPELPENFAELPDWEKLLELNAVFTKACEADVAGRYQVAAELRADLESIVAGKSVRRLRSVRRRWHLLARAAAILAVVVSVSAGIFYLWQRLPQPVSPQIVVESAKIHLPDGQLLAECEAQIKQVYQSQVASGKVADKQQAVADLVNRGATETDPAMKLASWHVAAQLAIESSDFAHAMQICDLMDNNFQIEILPVKAALLSSAGPYARTARDRSNLVESCLAAGFQAVAGNDYDSSKKIADTAEAAAQDSRDAHLIYEAGFLGAESERCAAAFEHIKSFAVLLRQKPGDPAACLAMGKFLCFAKEDWDGGLPLLARGNDPKLKAIAGQELNSRSKIPKDQIALGDAWWDLSVAAPDNDKPFYQKRARYWYLTGLAGLSKPDQASLQDQLEARIKSVPTQFAELHIESRVAGTEYVDIYSDEVQWHSSRRGTTSNKINQVNPGDFSENDLEIIKNSGSNRLMPNTVDFSTARLNDDRKVQRGGRAALQIFADHVRVTLSHPKAGAATMDVTVSFGNQP